MFRQLVTLAAAITLAALPTGTAHAAARNPYPTLIFSESFSGPLDTSRWHARDNMALGNESSYLLARNVWTTPRGHLRIQARRERVGGREYTSGALDTYWRTTLPRYFKARIYARVPQEQGMWAAPLWFRPTTAAGDPYGDTEIDLVETVGSDSEGGRAMVHHTIHGAYEPRTLAGSSVPFARFGDPTGTKWHTYVIRKTPGRIAMRVDGRLTALWRVGDPEWLGVFDHAPGWAMRVNLQVGGAWGGAPDHRTDWTAGKTALLVDDIRVWAWQRS